MKQCICSLKTPKKIQGFSYVEVLVATVLIAITLVPALEALEGALIGSKVHETLSVQQYHLQTKLEEVLAQSFDSLNVAAAAAGSATVATSFSDGMGAINRRIVYLSRYDGDNADGDADPFTGVDNDLLWVRVEIENTAYAFETLTNK
jgi:type II secretory pathway pseudopilin PulG